jgi:hypothetical protein
MLELLDLRHVSVPVDHGVAILETRRQTSLPPRPPPGVVDHPDPDSLDLDHPLPRQCLLQGRLVHVAADALDGRPDPTKLLEELLRDEVAAVQHEVGAGDQAYTLVGKPPLPAREMRVRDDGDAGQEAATGSRTTTTGSCRK